SQDSESSPAENGSSAGSENSGPESPAAEDSLAAGGPLSNGLVLQSDPYPATAWNLCSQSASQAYSQLNSGSYSVPATSLYGTQPAQAYGSAVLTPSYGSRQQHSTSQSGGQGKSGLAQSYLYAAGSFGTTNGTQSPMPPSPQGHYAYGSSYSSSAFGGAPTSAQAGGAQSPLDYTGYGGYGPQGYPYYAQGYGYRRPPLLAADGQYGADGSPSPPSKADTLGPSARKGECG
ncbi:unnamed protein product, partial [Ixodes persulcatus]